MNLTKLQSAALLVANICLVPSAWAQQDSAYALEVRLKDPLAYWRLNDSAATAADASGGGYNGTWLDAALKAEGPRPPAFVGFETSNGALQVTAGTDQSWVTAPQPQLSGGTVTFTAWVFPDGDQADWTGILMNRSGIGEGMDIGGGANHGMLTYTWNNNSGATYGFVSGLTIPQNEWSLVAVVIEPTMARLYLGAGGVVTSATNAIAHISEPWGGAAEIGNDICCGSGRIFNGLIDEVAIFGEALSTADIEALYAARAATIQDTDKDGMPDKWETANGLNPNDAADAALDCNGNGVTNLDEYKAGSDPCDATKPTVVSAVSTATFDTVRVTFSEALDPATATVAANYTITPALAVTAATYANKVVTLTTAAQTPGGTAYTVTVKGVKDLSKFEVPEGSNTATFFSYMLTRTGVLEFSFWGGITGTPVQGLYDDPRYPATPDWTGAVYSFNSRDILPTDANENYGATMEGYLTPTESGDYRFFIYSDDASQLFLSANETPVDPLTTQWIAEEPGCCNNFTEPDGVHTRTSEPIALVAGRKYYILMVYKEGGGGDYGQVAWRKEGDPTPAASLTPIPGKYLSSAVDLPAPAEGVFTRQTPAPNAQNVSPDTAVTIVHTDGKTPWTANNVTFKFDSIAVTPTFTKDANTATIIYKPASLLASGSTHTITLGYVDPAGQPATTEWSFEVAEYKGPVLDKVKAYPAILMDAAKLTDDKGGHTGAAGDLGLDVGVVTGVGYVPDASFLNAATADDTLTIAFFQKLRSVRAASGFWANSPSSNNGTRGYQAHTPWSDSTIYFDTSGCCTADVQRINLNIDQFADYSGDATWWEQWHHFAFVKDGTAKRIYINGKLFHEGLGDPLKTDFTTLVFGGGPSITENRLDGMLDDFVIYNGALTEAQALSLSGGAAPSSITGLLAHWDFNTIESGSAVADGLVAYWNFDGHLLDSIKDFHGTARGTAPVAFVDGKAGFGKAIKLDGTDQFVEITGGNENELEFPGGSMSIGGWFRVGAFDTEWQALISKGEGENYRVARRAATGAIAYAGGVGEGADDVPSVNDGQWHHFVAVSDATVAEFGTALYVDGVRRSVMATKPVLASSAFNLMIGENPGARGREWEGEIDDIALWNRVVTAAEVTTLYNAGQGTPISTLPGVNGPIAATITRSGSNVIIGWSPAGGTLEVTPVLGPTATWTPVGTANPATIAIGSGNAYYRVRQ